MGADRVIGDWGNSRLRLWRLERGAIVEWRDGPGIAAADNAAAALIATLDGWNAARIVLCGMAGARNGLREARYLSCPAGVADWASRALEFDLGGRTVAIAPGVTATDSGGRPDVMRGEETQVFGALARHPVLASGPHLVVLPGTHSKWVWLADGQIVSFRTFITGELFEMLKHSSLFAAGGSPVETEMEEGFSNGLARRALRAELSSLLFEARSAQLVEGKSAGWASGFISGVLIGAEIEEMQPDGTLTVIAEPKLAARYSRAFAHYGLGPTLLDAEECTIAGLRLLDADD
jgi:2-dehydro-3-deoxygalactonokinase